MQVRRSESVIDILRRTVFSAKIKHPIISSLLVKLYTHICAIGFHDLSSLNVDQLCTVVSEHNAWLFHWCPGQLLWVYWVRVGKAIRFKTTVGYWPCIAVSLKSIKLLIVSNCSSNIVAVVVAQGSFRSEVRILRSHPLSKYANAFILVALRPVAVRIWQEAIAV